MYLVWWVILWALENPANMTWKQTQTTSHTQQDLTWEWETSKLLCHCITPNSKALRYILDLQPFTFTRTDITTNIIDIITSPYKSRQTQKKWAFLIFSHTLKSMERPGYVIILYPLRIFRENKSVMTNFDSHLLFEFWGKCDESDKQFTAGWHRHGGRLSLYEGLGGHSDLITETSNSTSYVEHVA